MPFKLITSNVLNSLADKLAADLREQELGVFQPAYIITQTEGMNNWLKIELADRLGIAANYQFVKPNDIIFTIYRLLGGRQKNVLSRQSLSWLLFRIMGTEEFNTLFPGVAGYFGSGNERDIKRLGLSEKVADLFDQYQVYRADMIVNWNLTHAEDLQGEDWQQYLWIKAKELSGATLPDKTIVGQYIKEQLADPEQQAVLVEQVPYIQLFGLSITTAYHLAILQEVAKYVDITFYALNPAPGVYWFEDKSEKQLAAWKSWGYDITSFSSGNPLLSSWGRVLQDTYHLYFQNDDLLNNYEDVQIHVPQGNTLLHRLHADIFKNTTAGERAAVNMDVVLDGSVIINSCYTLPREVEVLYNYLVQLIDKKKETLSPRDIVVMVTDIDAYAPYIKAVFANAPYRFPFTIADESYASGDSMIASLQAVLAMNEENFKAEEVLQLLDSAFIRKRFGITDVQLARSVVSAANIRFGMEGKASDETVYVSWGYGIKRIRYGICMAGGEEYTIDGNTLFPLDIVEGAASQEVVNFCYFIEVLMDSIKVRKGAKTIAEWAVYIEEVLHNLVCEPEEEITEEYQLLMQQVQQLNVLQDVLSDKVSFEVFAYHFRQSISGTARTNSFAAGGITFCSLLPMRSIPFKVVAILGMNMDKFPRREVTSAFNIMEQAKRRGDRNVKDNDKHLFLETLLSAKEYLYISYIGQSCKDNTPVPPSVLIDELLDYIESGCDEPERVRAQIITKHPLHSFSQRYRKQDERYYSYLDTAATVASVFTTGKKSVPEELNEISIDSLISFFKNPFRWYYNKVLNIYYDEEQVLLSDTELFELDGMQQWQLKQDLLVTDTGDLSTIIEKYKKTGLLPLKHMADIFVMEIEEQIHPMRQLFNEVTGKAESTSVQFEVDIDGVALSGTVKGIYNDKLVRLSFSKNECKYLLESTLYSLALTAAGHDVQPVYVSANKGKAFYGSTASKVEARKKLRALLDLYREGQQEILAFHPDLNIAPRELDDLLFDKFQKKVNDLVNNERVPSNDKYLLNEYNNGFFETPERYEKYLQHATVVLIPLQETFTEYYKQ